MLSTIVQLACAVTLVGQAQPAAPPPASASLSAVVRECQAKVVKIYGAGGLRGLEPYQSGVLMSANGHILTVWSYVLDTDYITVVLDSGRKLEGKLLGADPTLEMAVLKVEGSDFPHFELVGAEKPDVGSRVLAFSNLFGVAGGNEPVSVQQGTIAALTDLNARRGSFETPYHGPVYVVDAITNNPGAAGGALTTRRGELLAMLGKELRSASSDIWLNYAIPIDQLRRPLDEIISGKTPNASRGENRSIANPLRLGELGIALVPDVLERTPPFVDTVEPGSAAAAAGVKADDLIVFVGRQLVPSRTALADELAGIESGSELTLVLMRGGQLVEVALKPGAARRKQDGP